MGRRLSRSLPGAGMSQVCFGFRSYGLIRFFFAAAAAARKPLSALDSKTSNFKKLSINKPESLRQSGMSGRQRRPDVDSTKKLKRKEGSCNCFSRVSGSSWGVLVCKRSAGGCRHFMCTGRCDVAEEDKVRPCFLSVKTQRGVCFAALLVYFEAMR